MKFYSLILAAFCIFCATGAVAEDISADPNHTVIVGGDSSSGSSSSNSGSSSDSSGLSSLTGGGSSFSSGGNQALSNLDSVCGGDVIDANSQELKIFSVGVKCFENITAGLAEKTIQDFSSFLAQIVYIVMILYVTFVGVKIATGLSAGPRLKSETIVGAIKLCVVAFLVYGFDNGFNIGIGFGNLSTDISAITGLDIGSQPGLVQIYAMVVSSYHSLITIVMPQNAFGNCSGGGGLGGLSGITGGTFSSGGTDAIWQNMDCMFSNFIGWNAQNGWGNVASGGNSSQPSSYTGVAMLFGYITSKWAPANGFFIGWLIFSTLLSLMMGFFRLAFVYIISMIALILLFSVGPLMVPMMLFKSTEKYFDSWIRLIFGTVIQPVILFAFFSFVSGLLATTIQKVQQLFSSMKTSFETSGVQRTGDTQTVNSVFNMGSSNGSNLDEQAVINGVIVMVIAFLLIKFIDFVGEMAAELSGAPTLNFQALTPKFAQN